MTPLTVIKVGGAVVEQPDTLAALLDRFATIPTPKVLVHGGGRTATHLATRLGLETQMVAGRRVTDEQMLRVVTMVYGGLVNKTIVAQLQARGQQALGLTGADLDTLRSHRRPPRDIGGQTVDYGYVGDIDQANGRALADLISLGITPVIAPLTHDGHGQLLNTNADTIAAATARGLAPYHDITLTYCFERAGVLRDSGDETSVIPHIRPADFERLTADGTINGGMIPKIQAAFDALRGGVRQVVITHAGHLGDPTAGTHITL